LAKLANCALSHSFRPGDNCLAGCLPVQRAPSAPVIGGGPIRVPLG
jgi:hypothetical protein